MLVLLKLQSQSIHVLCIYACTEYSIVDGLVRIDDVVKAALKDRQPAMAMTDLANLFGMIKFYKTARGKGIKPVAGCDVWITNEADREKPSRLLILVKDRTGYLQLCELLTSAWLTNQHRGRAEIRFEWLEQIRSAGEDGHLIVLSGRTAVISVWRLIMVIMIRQSNARSAGQIFSPDISISKFSAQASRIWNRMFVRQFSLLRNCAYQWLQPIRFSF
jgi:DNA polymerase III alpha subunit